VVWSPYNERRRMAKQSATKWRTAIGWREWAGLPDFGVSAIDAKIDTGAKSSAIHAHRIRAIFHDGCECVEFFLYPDRGRQRSEIFCVAPLVDTRIIRSSNGEEEERYVVETRLDLGGQVRAIDLTLTNRGAMEFCMLIGRDALCGKFIVDPSASYLLGEH